MPSDISVPRVAAVTPLGEPARQRNADGLVADPPLHERAAPSSVARANPSLRLDPALSVVVIEFRDESGAVRTSIPTQQQLDAYRSWDRGHAGAAPQGGAPGPGRRAAELASGGPARPTRHAAGAAAPPPAPAAAPAVKRLASSGD